MSAGWGCVCCWPLAFFAFLAFRHLTFEHLCIWYLCICAFGIWDLCICALAFVHLMFEHLCICAFVHLSICAFVHSCIRAFVHSCIRAFSIWCWLAYHINPCIFRVSASSSLIFSPAQPNAHLSDFQRSCPTTSVFTPNARWGEWGPEFEFMAGAKVEPPAGVSRRSLTCFDASFRSFKVSWQPPQSVGAPIESYCLQFSLDGVKWSKHFRTAQTQLLLDGLEPGTKYFVRAKAKNAAGWGPYGDPATGQTKAATLPLKAVARCAGVTPTTADVEGSFATVGRSVDDAKWMVNG